MIVRLWLRGIKNPAYRRRISERFGYLPHKPQPGGLWVHAVSVGETIAAAPMIRAFIEQNPQTAVIVTTTTPTGSDQVKRLFGERVFHMYLPFDLGSMMNRFIRSISPGLLVIMETELWPNMIQSCRDNQVPVMLANARLSEKSAQGYAKYPALAEPMLQGISKIAAQHEEDGQRFIELGISQEQLEVTGSVKFDVKVPDNIEEEGKALRQAWGEERPVLALASSHPDEDEQLLAQLPKLLIHCPDLLLMLIPRHPERFDAVTNAALGQGYKTDRRSRGTLSNNTQVYVADTLGEMLPLLSAADLVLMGGSLISKGGHNPLEPASIGKATLIGPNYTNFAAIVDDLKGQQAIDIIENNDQIADKISFYLTHPDERSNLGQNALKVLNSNRGVVNKLLKIIDALLNKV